MIAQVRSVWLARPEWVGAALTLLFAALCLHGLAAQPLWNDEAFSFFVAWQGFAHTLHMMRQDTQPPAYYVLLSAWLQLGHGVFVLRLLSALAMVAAVPLVFGAARRLLGTPVAVLAALLFVLGPENLAWAQKARPYPVQAFFVALGFWGFARVWLPAGRRRWVGWAAYVAGAGLAVLTQYPAVFFVLACNVAAAARIGGDWRGERRFAVHWLAAQCGLLAVWLPWLPFALPQVLSHLTPAQIAARHSIFLIDRAGLADRLLGELSIQFLWRAQPAFAALHGVIGLAGVVALVRAGRAGLPVLAGVAAPLAACIAGWALLNPVFGYVIYSFVWLRVAYCMLLAAGLAWLRPRWLAAALGGLALLGNVWGIANYKSTTTVPLDRVAQAIAAEAQPGDGLIYSINGAARWAIAYYLGPPYAGRLVGLDVADMPREGGAILTREQALQQRRLWVVWPDGETMPVQPADLAPTLQLALHRRFGPVALDRYDRR